MVDFKKAPRTWRPSAASSPPAPAEAPPPPESSLAPPFRPGAGQPWGSRTTTHHGRNGEKTVTEHAEDSPVTAGPSAGQAMASMSLQVTIPGPERSYMSTVIRVGLSLPVDPAFGVRAAYDTIEGYVSERLDKEARAVQAHYAKLSR